MVGTPLGSSWRPRTPARGVPSNRPPCHVCRQAWPLPRDLVYRLVAFVPEHIKPSTPEMVVAYQNTDPHTQRPRICEQVFHNLSPTRPVWKHRCFGILGSWNHSLVQEFEYHKE